MPESDFMQLFLVFILLMALGQKGGNSSPQNNISVSEMAEIIKYAVGENHELDNILKEAEQISEAISAIAPIAAALGGKPSSDNVPEADGAETVIKERKSDTALFLKPIADIADDGIYNALSRAIE